MKNRGEADRTTLKMLDDHLQGWVDHLQEVWDKGYEEVGRWESEDVLEIQFKRGAPFVILLTYGGPNIWIEHDVTETTWALNGSWGWVMATRHDKIIETIGEYVLDHMRELYGENDE